MFRQGLRGSAGLTRRILPQAAVALGRQQRLVAQTIRPSMPVIHSWKAVMQAVRMYSSEAAAEVPVKGDSAVSNEPATEFSSLADIGVDKQLLRAIVDDMGYQSMTPVQAKTINPALKGTDIVAQAKTGTGKTLAFLLPLMQRMISEDPSLATKSAKYVARSDDIRGIVLSPTRELAEQIAEEARRLARRTGLVIQSAVGGTQKSQMLRDTRRRGCHLLVATPGRLNDLLSDPSSGIAAPNLAALVLDEADRMLDVGFERELNQIIGMLPNTDEKVRQTMLVSATIPDTVIRLTRNMVRPNDFEFVQTIAETDTLTHDRIPQNVVAVSHMNNIFPALFELIDKSAAEAAADPKKKPFKAIVYFNTTSMVQLAGQMGFQKRRRDRGPFRYHSIHSGLSQNGRTNAAENFRQSKSAVLFSSDVTARGMDFPNVTHVIQVDCPRDRETYIHRLGRTGRQGKDGEGWLLLPNMSRRMARNLLHGLPINPNTSLESASYDAESGEQAPDIISSTNELYALVGREHLEAAYNTIFNVDRSTRDEYVEQMNEWTVKGWGWIAPPKVSRNHAVKCGLGNADLNFGTPDSFESETRGSDRFSRGNSDQSGRSSRSSSDPFENMTRQIRRDDHGGGRPSRTWDRNSRNRNSSRNSRNSRNSRFSRDSRGSRDHSDSSW